MSQQPHVGFGMCLVITADDKKLLLTSGVVKIHRMHGSI